MAADGGWREDCLMANAKTQRHQRKETPSRAPAPSKSSLPAAATVIVGEAIQGPDGVWSLDHAPTVCVVCHRKVDVAKPGEHSLEAAPLWQLARTLTIAAREVEERGSYKVHGVLSGSPLQHSLELMVEGALRGANQVSGGGHDRLRFLATFLERHKAMYPKQSDESIAAGIVALCGLVAPMFGVSPSASRLVEPFSVAVDSWGTARYTKSFLQLLAALGFSGDAKRSDSEVRGFVKRWRERKT